MKMKMTSNRKLHKFPWRAASTAAAVALLLLTLTSCKKKQTAATANAQADAQTAAIASGAAVPAARHIADGTNVSVDGGNS